MKGTAWGIPVLARAILGAVRLQRYRWYLQNARAEHIACQGVGLVRRLR